MNTFDCLPDYTCEICGQETKIAMAYSKRDRRIHCGACALRYTSELDKLLRSMTSLEENSPLSGITGKYKKKRERRKAKGK